MMSDLLDSSHPLPPPLPPLLVPLKFHSQVLEKTTDYHSNRHSEAQVENIHTNSTRRCCAYEGARVTLAEEIQGESTHTAFVIADGTMGERVTERGSHGERRSEGERGHSKRLELMVEVAKKHTCTCIHTHTHTLTPVYSCQDPRASTCCLQALSNCFRSHMQVPAHIHTHTLEKVCSLLTHLVPMYRC